mmetsp:Transcript_17796/g.41899  ORF Transcript_17796/g.41899 Transcript_17796/m.41899 type:complete len:292 (-) Transcript_17796:1162-2037(-)
MVNGARLVPPVQRDPQAPWVLRVLREHMELLAALVALAGPADEVVLALPAGPESLDPPDLLARAGALAQADAQDLVAHLAVTDLLDALALRVPKGALVAGARAVRPVVTESQVGPAHPVATASLAAVVPEDVVVRLARTVPAVGVVPAEPLAAPVLVVAMDVLAAPAVANVGLAVRAVLVDPAVPTEGPAAPARLLSSALVVDPPVSDAPRTTRTRFSSRLSAPRASLGVMPRRPATPTVSASATTAAFVPMGLASAPSLGSKPVINGCPTEATASMPGFSSATRSRGRRA